MISYGVFRFFIEFLRGDDRGNTILGIISPSQFLSIIMIICGILLFIFEDKIVNALKKKYNPDLITVDANTNALIDTTLNNQKISENESTNE